MLCPTRLMRSSFMGYVLYFRNVRRDGGIRIGIEANGERLFHQFIDGPEIKDLADENPAINWFIDLFFEGKSVPAQPERIRKWLAKLGPFVRKGLESLAEDLRAGVDED